METSLKRSIGWLTAARVVVLLLILLSAILVSSGTGVQFDRQALREPAPARDELSFLYLLNGAAVLLGIFHWTVGRRLPARGEAYVQILGDLGIVTTLVYVSGGPDSVFTFLYLVVIGVSAFLLLRTGAVLVASVAAVLYGSVVQLLAYGLLPPPPLAPVSDWAGARVRYNLAITVAGFYGIAFMVSYLSEKLLAARDELALRQRALQRLQHLYGNVIATMSSGLMTTDGRQRVTFLNRAGGELLGLEPSRAPGRPLSELGFRFAQSWEEIRERARGPETYRDEIEIARGTERRVLGFSLRML